MFTGCSYRLAIDDWKKMETAFSDESLEGYRPRCHIYRIEALAARFDLIDIMNHHKLSSQLQ